MLQLPRLEDIRTDRFDVLRRGGDIRALTPRTVLYEHQVPFLRREVL